MAPAKKGPENSFAGGGAGDDGDTAVDTGKMKSGISWLKMSISLAAFAGAAFLFWRASQIGLSPEKIVYTVLAVALGVIGFLAFIFSVKRNP